MLISKSQDAASEALRSLPAIEYGKPRLKHYLEYIAYQAFSVIWQVVPRAVAHGGVSCLVSVLRHAMVRLNRRAREDIGKSLGTNCTQTNKILAESYRNVGKTWVDLVRLPKVPPGAFRCENTEVLAEMAKQERGVVLIGGHLGCWELTPYVMNACGFPSAVMAAVQHNPLCDRAFNRKREQGETRMLHNRLGVRHLYRLLKAGGRIGIVADVDVGKNGMFIPFLGRKASTPSWPAELCVRTNSAMVMLESYVDENNILIYRLHPAVMAAAFGEDKDAQLVGLTTHMNDSFSQFIRAHPGQWFWQQRRWKTPLPEKRA